ncbi:MAG TPA: phospholipase D-like domain-containing protein [Anaerolineales bacterium]|jgi:phosphatidylserine/phosphatidylglycerophosphate/cardiolipin synthase-like enzyme|nr:phospholipase D-like domain-containing protein [Anaerolineales bacterium]
MPRRRAKSRTDSSVTLFVLIILFIFGIYYSITGRDPGGVFGSGTPTAVVATETSPAANVPTAVNASGTWWEVYFTDPVNINNPEDWQSSVEGRLIEKIHAAQDSIHIASFEFDLTPVAEALIAAKQRGVDVRWVTDNEHGIEADEEPGHGQFAMLQEAGIEVRADTRSALMHNKFWIFDGQIVWTGSTNVTENGIFDQDNNVVVIQSPELATIYEREFQEMWDGQFGPKSPSTLDQQVVTLNGSRIVVVFTSEDPALENAIVPIVQSAKQSIRFLTFSFTDYPLADAMSQRFKAGVDVAGVFEKVGSETEAAELRTLMCRSVPVKQDGNPGFLHHKVIVVDERIVITGSLNFSTNAEENNDENVIIIDNPDIARLYLQEFDRVWSLASDPEVETIACG